MESLHLNKEKIIKDIRNLFRQKKEIEAIKDRRIGILRIFLSMKKKKENYYKPVRIRKCLE